MELIRGLHNLKDRHHGCVATIGNFDGIHLGHQKVLTLLKAQAAQLGLPSTVITFEPQPQEFFAPEAAVPRLTRLREKIELLSAHGVDRMLVLEFDQRLADTPAEAFIQRIMIDGLGIRFLVVGDDFRFGKGRRGDFAMLEAAGRAHGFEVAATPSYCVDGERVSSTGIRTALAQGDMEKAAQFLGRPYHMSGRVAHGDKRGSTIGFPTANIHLHRRRSPIQGVYAVEMRGIAERPLPAVANVGNRPTVDGVRCLLEVHILDFEGDIYGKYVQVAFLHKLRAEKRFDSLEALVHQITADCEQARAYFAASEAAIH